MDSLIFHRSDVQALVPAIRPAATRTSDGAIDGAVIDQQALSDRYEDLVADIVTGAYGGTVTSMTLTSKFQHRATSSDSWEDVTDLNTVEAATKVLSAQNSQQTFALRLSHCKRYVKMVSTLDINGSDTPSVFLAANYRLGRPTRLG